MTQRQLAKLAELLRRIEGATSQRGKKTELAKFLGVTPQGLNDWLSGRREPGGEVTLLMLEWVSAEETKQPNKKRGSTDMPPRRKTRKAQTYEEKDKRVRKRS